MPRRQVSAEKHRRNPLPALLVGVAARSVPSLVVLLLNLLLALLLLLPLLPPALVR